MFQTHTELKTKDKKFEKTFISSTLSEDTSNLRINCLPVLPTAMNDNCTSNGDNTHTHIQEVPGGMC
jgi:hypothetical protein